MTNPIKTSIAQHTPGPWRIGFYEISESCLKIQIEPVDSSKLAVAYAWGVDHEATEANAHLIAAAPELLEALKVAEAFLLYEYQHQGKPSHLINSLTEMKIIRAAIAKAEGRQS